jgi:hypothetical protein
MVSVIPIPWCCSGPAGRSAMAFSRARAPGAAPDLDALTAAMVAIAPIFAAIAGSEALPAFKDLVLQRWSSILKPPSVAPSNGERSSYVQMRNRDPSRATLVASASVHRSVASTSGLRQKRWSFVAGRVPGRCPTNATHCRASMRCHVTAGWLRGLVSSPMSPSIVPHSWAVPRASPTTVCVTGWPAGPRHARLAASQSVGFASGDLDGTGLSASHRPSGHCGHHGTD